MVEIAIIEQRFDEYEDTILLSKSMGYRNVLVKGEATYGQHRIPVDRKPSLQEISTGQKDWWRCREHRQDRRAEDGSW